MALWSAVPRPSARSACIISITAAVSGGWGQGISTVIDVMGYNYIDHGNTDVMQFTLRRPD